jgi:hypothetical protein
MVNSMDITHFFIGMSFRLTNTREELAHKAVALALNRDETMKGVGVRKRRLGTCAGLCEKSCSPANARTRCWSGEAA